MFNESEWLKLLFLLSDTQVWLNELAKECFSQLPLNDKKKFFRKTYYLTSSTLAHILERHYYKIARYPDAGKFTIPVTDILYYLREAFHCPASNVLGSLNFQRVIDAGTVIGFDRYGKNTTLITVITDNGGQIKTAFPGQTDT
jgi:hypothetical protein